MKKTKKKMYNGTSKMSEKERIELLILCDFLFCPSISLMICQIGHRFCSLSFNVFLNEYLCVHFRDAIMYDFERCRNCFLFLLFMFYFTVFIELIVNAEKCEEEIQRRHSTNREINYNVTKIFWIVNIVFVSTFSFSKETENNSQQ